MHHTKLLHTYWRVESQEGGLCAALASFGAAHEVDKWQLAVLLHGGEAKMLAAEEEQGVEQHYGRESPQLLTVPEELLLHPGVDGTCSQSVLDQVLSEGGLRRPETDRENRHNSPLAVHEGLKALRVLANTSENLL